MKFAYDITNLKEQLIKVIHEKEELLTAITEMQNTIGSSNPEENKKYKSLQDYQEALKKELSEKLSKNEASLKKALEQQKKDLGLS